MERSEVALVVGAGDATGGAIARRFARRRLYGGRDPARAPHGEGRGAGGEASAPGAGGRTASASMRARRTKWSPFVARVERENRPHRRRRL